MFNYSNLIFWITIKKTKQWNKTIKTVAFLDEWVSNTHEEFILNDNNKLRNVELRKNNRNDDR